MQYLPSNPRISFKYVSSFTLFFSASLSLFSTLYFTSVLYPPNFSIDRTSSWSPPKYFHIFSTMLSHLIPARPFVIFSYAALSTMAGSLSIFSTLYFTSVLYPPNFSIDRTSSWSPSKYFHIFSTMLSHLIPARSFVIFSYAALSTMAGNLFSGIILRRGWMLMDFTKEGRNTFPIPLAT